MKYGCSRINLPFGYTASRIYLTLDSLKEKLFKESKTCLEPDDAIYEWWADNYDSVSQFFDLSGKTEQQLADETRFSVSENTGDDEPSPTIKTAELDKPDENPVDLETLTYDQQAADNWLYGSNSILTTIRNNEFRKNVTRCLFSYQEGNTYTLVYNDATLNRAIQKYRNTLFETLKKYLDLKFAEDDESKKRVEKLYKFRDSDGIVDKKKAKLFLKLVETMLLRENNSLPSGQTITDVLNLQALAKLDYEHDNPENYALLDVVNAYTQVKFFDSLLMQEMGKTIVFDEAQMNVECDSAIVKGEGKDKQVTPIYKYTIGEDRENVVRSWNKGEYRDAIAEISKLSQTMLDLLEVRDDNNQQLSDKTKISIISLGWNTLIDILTTKNLSGGDRLDAAKKAASEITLDPNKNIKIVLRYIDFIRNNQKQRDQLFENGLDSSIYNVLLSIYDTFFTKKSKNTISNIEERAITGAYFNEDNDIVEMPNFPGIQTLSRENLIINLLYQMSPANYLRTKIFNGETTIGYTPKQSDIEKMKFDYLTNLETSYYRETQAEMQALTDGTNHITVAYDRKAGDSSERRLDRFYLTIRDTEYLVLGLSNTNEEQNITEKFAKVAIFETLDEDKIKNIQTEIDGLLDRIKDQFAEEQQFKNFKKSVNDVISQNIYNVKLQDLIISKIRSYLEENNKNIILDQVIEKIEETREENNSKGNIYGVLQRLRPDVSSEFSRSIGSRNQQQLLNGSGQELTTLRDFLYIASQTLRLPFNTKEGLENLNYAARSIKGDPVKAIMTSALRALFVDKITSDYYKAANEYAENEENKGTLSFREFYDKTFGWNSFQNCQTAAFGNVKSYGGTEVRINPLPPSEGWIEPYFMADITLNGKGLPSTTVTVQGNRVANYRNQSLAALWNEDHAALAADPNSAAHNNLFVMNRGEHSLVQSIGYDSQVEVGYEGKDVKNFSQRELLYHSIMNNFFDSLVSNRFFNIQPTVYSDRTSFVIYQIGYNKDVNYKLDGEEFQINLAYASIDELKKAYRATTGDYFKRSYRATLNKFVDLFKFHDIAFPEESKLIDIYFNDNADEKGKTIYIQKKLKNITKEQLKKYIDKYNAAVETARDELDGVTDKATKEQILKKYNIPSDKYMKLAVDADYRIRNGKLSLHELGFAYSEQLHDPIELDVRFNRELKNTIITLLQNGVDFRVEPGSSLNHIINGNSDEYSQFRRGMKSEDFKNKWVDKAGNLILAKVKSGSTWENVIDISQLNGVILDEFEVNPIIERWFYLENLLSSNLRLAQIGSEVADPDKTSGVSVESIAKEFEKTNPEFHDYIINNFDSVTDIGIYLQGNPLPSENDIELQLLYDEAINKIINACENAQYKRNVIIPATMIPMNVNSLNGLGMYTKMAIIDDEKGLVFNLDGDGKSVDACDGSAYRLGIQAILENGSLGDQSTGYELAKTIWHCMDRETGKAFLAKWATFTMTNAMMRESQGSTKKLYNIFYKMTKKRWNGRFNLTGSRKFLLSEKDTNRNTNISFARDILMHVPGNEIFYKSKDTIYQITDFRNAKDDIEFSELVNGTLAGDPRGQNLYYSVEKYKDGKDEKSSYSITLFDENSNAIQLRADSSQEVIGKALTELKNNPNLHVADSIFELHYVMGGINNATSFSDDTVTEASNYAVASFCNNVVGKIDFSVDGNTQTRYQQPLKSQFIGYLAHGSAIKRMQYNMNPTSALYDDTDLSYIELDNRRLGKQQDPDHKADEAKVSEMSQVVASLDAGGENHLFAKQAYEALGRLAANALKIQIELISQESTSDKATQKKISSKLYHILGRSMFKNIKGIDTTVDITKTIMDTAREDFKQQGIYSHNLEANMETYLPLSDPNMFGNLIKSIVTDINKNALKRKYDGLPAVLVPSFNSIQMYHLDGMTSGATYTDIYRLALNGEQALVKKSGNISPTTKCTYKDSKSKIGDATIQVSETDGKYEIVIKDSRIKPINFQKLTNLLIGAIDDIGHNKQIIIKNGNETVIKDALEILKQNKIISDYAIDAENGISCTSSIYSQNQRMNAVVEAYLQLEQQKNIYYHEIGYFIPTDIVDVIFDDNIETVSLDSLSSYYQFKYAFKNAHYDEVSKKAQERCGGDPNTEEGYQKIQDEIDNHFVEYAKMYFGNLDIDQADYKSYSKIIADSKFSKYKEFFKYLRMAWHKDVRFRDNIIKPKNLRPQRLSFTQKGTTKRYNIFDLDAVVDKYLMSAKPNKTFVWKYVEKSESRKKALHDSIQEQMRNITGTGENNYHVVIDGTTIEIDKNSIKNEPAEAVISNIYKSLFNQGDRTLLDIERNFKDQISKEYCVTESDLVLCTPHSHINIMCHTPESINVKYSYVNDETEEKEQTEFHRDVLKDDFEETDQPQDIIENEEGGRDIFAIDKNGNPKYQIGTLVLRNDVQVIDDQFFTKAKDSEDGVKLPKSDFVLIDNKIYEKKYYMRELSKIIDNKKERFIYFDKSAIIGNSGNQEAYNKYVGETIKLLQKTEGWQWLQLNGYFDFSQKENVKMMLDYAKENSFKSEAFNLSLESAISYLNEPEFDGDDAQVKLFDEKTHPNYRDKLKQLQAARKYYAKSQFALSKYIVAARIPAQNLQSYMNMQVIGYVPVSTNQAFVSHFQTWIQGSDYDIDKSYMMSFGYNKDGSFADWSPLFDYSSIESARESLKLPMPEGIEIRQNEGSETDQTGQNIIEIVKINDELDSIIKQQSKASEGNKIQLSNGEILTETEVSYNEKGIPKITCQINNLTFTIEQDVANVVVTINGDQNLDINDKSLIYEALPRILSENQDSLTKIDKIKFKISTQQADNTSQVETIQLSSISDSEAALLENYGFKLNFSDNVIQYNQDSYISRLKANRIRLYAEILNNASENNSNGAFDFYISEYDFQNHKDGINEVRSQLNKHEQYEIPITELELANKNYVASRIMQIVNDPKSIQMAYDPVTADPLKALASGTVKAKSSDQMTSMNPLTKMIMQYQNMDGKQVIGIAAIGEKVFMGLSYYFNEGLVSDDADYHRYMKFFHTSHRIAGRAKGSPHLCIRTEKTDNNYTRALKKYGDNFEQFQRDLLQMDEVIKIVKAEPSIPGMTLQEKIKKYYGEQGKLWTQADAAISMLLTAATDNAKELILTKINGGQALAKIYLHLLILGYSIDDTVAFMSSKSVTAIDMLTSSNIFSGEDVRIKDIYDIVKKDEFYKGDFNSLVDEVNKEGSQISNLKDKVNKYLKSIDPKNPHEPKLLEFIRTSDLTLSEKLQIQDLLLSKLPANYKATEYRRSKIILGFKMLQLLKNNDCDYSEFAADLEELYNLDIQANEMSSLGTMMGIAKGIDPRYSDLLQQVIKIEKIYNRKHNYFSYTYLDEKSKSEKPSYGIYLMDEKSDEDVLKNAAREDACINKILETHPNYTKEKVKEIIKTAISHEIIKWNSGEEAYKSSFDLEQFVSDDAYRKAATDFYDIIKSQYNIFDVIHRIPHYWQAICGLYTANGITSIATVKNQIINIVKGYVTEQNAPFENYEISRAQNYANELLLFKWIQQYQQTSSKPLVFQIHKGDYMYDKYMNLVKAEEDQLITIKTLADLQTFKIWMEKSLVPALRSGSEDYLIDGQSVVTDPNNEFINSLMYAKDKNFIYMKLNFIMTDVDSNSRTMSKFARMVNDFNRLDIGNLGLPVKITDYFILYNLLVNKNQQGRDRLTTLFSYNIAQGDSILSSYFKFVAQEDEKMRRFAYEKDTRSDVSNEVEFRKERLKQYIKRRYGYSDTDVRLQLAKQRKEGSKKHNNELAYIEVDAAGNMKFKIRKNDRGRKSEYEDAKATQSSVYPFLEGADEKSKQRRLRNFVEDGIFFIPAAGNSQNLNVQLRSDRVEDVKKALQYLMTLQKVKAKIRCS